MTDIADLVIQIEPAADEDTEDLATAAARLRDELLDLDVQAVDLVTESAAPEGAKGLSALAGWLGVHLGKEALRTVLVIVANLGSPQ